VNLLCLTAAAAAAAAAYCREKVKYTWPLHWSFQHAQDSAAWLVGGIEHVRSVCSAEILLTVAALCLQGHGAVHSLMVLKWQGAGSSGHGPSLGPSGRPHFCALTVEC
jgi:hypothetical protein